MPPPRPRPRPIPELTRLYAQAVECIQAGRLDEAERLGARIRKALPDSHEGVHLIGVVKLQRGHAGAALPLIEAALKINPQASDAWSNRGLALGMLGRDEEALASFARALELRADDPDMFNGRGRLLLKLRRPADALADFERAVALAPGHLGALTNRGNALGALGRHEEALAQYDALLADHPGHPALHFNRGHALERLDRHEDAIAAYDRALAIRPDYVAAHLDRGTALQALNRHAEALASFAQVLALDADHADAQHNAALSRLTLGDYRAGFKHYEARLARSGMPARRRLGKPSWLGEYAQRKTILLHAEQGLGDTIQFARYAPLVARMGATVVLEAPPELAGLLRRLAGVAAVVERGAPLPAFDLHCPMGSLPLALATEADSIPAAIPYLTASAQRIAQWQPRLAPLPQPRIGFVWSGRPGHPNNHNRSLPLARLAPLLEMEQVSWISLQPEVSEPDAAVLADLAGVTALGAALRDFEDTAAALELCDLVITVDTAVAHLAGALGRPTWILLPFAPDWRWMLERSDSPWYPTARLYRQPEPGDWESVLARVRADLAAMV